MKQFLTIAWLFASFSFSVLAQDSRRIQIGDRGQSIPQSLLATVSVDLKRVPFDEALSVISEQGNFKLNFNRSRIPVDQKVSVSMTNVHALEVLLHILEKTQTELLITRDGQLAIVPSSERKSGTGSVKGRVTDQETKEPLPFTNITIAGTTIGGASAQDGTFVIEKVPVGVQTVQFQYLGYKLKRENIEVSKSSPPDLTVELIPEAIKLNEVVVTPGQFAIMGEGPAVRQTLTHEDLETVPFGEDIYRATTRLPGISAGDFSAKFSVRGGENDEIQVLLDGLQLYQPFHLKDIEGGALSIIDVAAIENIDLMTGGFSSEFGDRMSGVFNIRSIRPQPGKRQTSLGVSFMNARFMTDGTFDNGRGAWLFSARRGYLDMVMKLMEEENPAQPVYYDILSKVEHRLDENQVLSVHFLHSGDRLDYIEDDGDEDNTSYGNSYGWLRLRSTPFSGLFIQTVASYGRLTHNRDGLGYEGTTDLVDFTVSDHREVDLYGIRQDWTLELSDNFLIKTGLDYKTLQAHYDYHSIVHDVLWIDGEPFVTGTDTTGVRTEPSGTQFGFYLANRFRPFAALTAEIGARYDHNSFTGDDLWSPRVNLGYAVGKQTFLRGGWGYFYQSQGIHEIQVSEGESGFHPAERAKHYVAGLEHSFRNGFNFRLEGYYKEISDLRPDYRNWTNSIEFFPEVQDDRFRLNRIGATSKGIEAYLKYDRGGKVSWWVSYALAKVTEDVESIVYQGTEFTDSGGKFPGRFDQRHSLYLDVNYRPNQSWRLNFAWQFHTGWPYTERVMVAQPLPDGSTNYALGIEQFYGSRFTAYHRLDFSVNRHFYTSHGRISAFFALINVYDQPNVRDIEYQWRWNASTQQPYLQRNNEHWFRLLPSIGLSWSWNH